MREIEIRNNYLIAKIGSFGAELTSLIDIQDSMELIWQANKEVWGRSSPTPFPIMGGFPNDEYTVSGKPFHRAKQVAH